MKLLAYLSKIRFANGQTVDLERDSLTVFVGPNNSGKSAALTDIKIHLGQSGRDPLVITSARVVKITSMDEIKNILSPYYQSSSSSYKLGGSSVSEYQFSSWADKEKSSVGYLFKYLVSDLTTQMRLSDCTPPASFEARDEYAAQHPFQYMYRDDKIQQSVSHEIRRAFKSDLVVHMAGGSNIPLYIGERPELQEGEHLVSRNYLDRVEKLDKLEEQGDGVRSFVSIVSRVMTENRSIQLIDEPEAFLHPPQAKLIGEIIAEKSEGRQTFISTHSSNLIQGLLSSRTSRISIVRLTRQGTTGTARHLESSAIEALWKNPILQFSDVLSGIFHDAVVVTEADADCRFYEAMASSNIASDDRLDVHYVYSGGKDRISTIVAALVGLEVPVAAIVDFDILNSEYPLRNVIEAYGANWNDFANDWTSVKNAVESKATFLGSADFKKQIKELLDGIGTDLAVPKKTLSDVRRLTRRASPWDHVKMSGLAGMPSGEPTKAAKRLLDGLRKVGIFVVPNGEMEGFCRDVGNHGPRWVEQVLERDLEKDEDLRDARNFAISVNQHFRDRLAVVPAVNSKVADVTANAPDI